MYVPSHFSMSDVPAMHRHIRRNAFATVAGAIGGEVHLAYIPVVLDEAPAPLGGVRFHLARANPLAKMDDGAALKLSWLGAHAYVSPDWYESNAQVPTWNYVAVEATGRVRRLDASELRGQIEELAGQEEAALLPKPPWTTQAVDAGQVEKMLSAIVGFQLAFDTLEGKAKLSQNKTAIDVAGVITGLQERGDGASIAVAALVQQFAKR
jgi:transcriptional regulator